MHGIEEMSAWTTEEALGAALASVPKGARLDYYQDGGFWFAQLFDEEGTVVWYTEPSVDPRITFIEAYTRLHVKAEAAPTNPLWVRRLDPDQIHGRVTMPGTVIPDPEDLDPAEVEKFIKVRR